MISNKAKLLCVIAFALTAGGCGGGGSDDAVGTAADVADSITNVTAATGSTLIRDGIATPVLPVSSAQMDAYVENPLVSDIPTELNGGASTVSGAYITNPLVR